MYEPGLMAWTALLTGSRRGLGEPSRGGGRALIYGACWRRWSARTASNWRNVRLRDLLGVFSDQAGLGDVTGTGLSGWLIFGQGGLGGEPLGNDLIGGLAIQHTLPTGVVGGVEATQELFELLVRVDGDGEHVGDDAAIEALDHAIGLRRTWLGMAILCAELGADFGEGLGEAAAVVCQYMCHVEGQGSGRFTQEGVHPALLRFYTVAYCTPCNPSR